MLNINILIAAVCLVLLLIFLIYKKFSGRQQNTNVVENTSNVLPISGINNKKPEIVKLTLQEKIELSWKFLYDITDIIINKFSKEDVEQVNKCGHALLNNGGKYEHIVDLNIQQAKSKTQSVEQSQAKGKNVSI